ncbi:hypothetical protein KIL84_021297 [Mauremys mutica]|uniref:Uncharacterized protein n=1 Tax=Mauremys mutica TaxID=74926 RepID=A0A9D4AZV0_9SAUR|nr:hypothetical protein KIL84_021297 [Mauremys mutica]
MPHAPCNQSLCMCNLKGDGLWVMIFIYKTICPCLSTEDLPNATRPLVHLVRNLPPAVLDNLGEGNTFKSWPPMQFCPMRAGSFPSPAAQGFMTLVYAKVHDIHSAFRTKPTTALLRCPQKTWFSLIVRA